MAEWNRSRVHRGGVVCGDCVDESRDRRLRRLDVDAQAGIARRLARHRTDRRRRNARGRIGTAPGTLIEVRNLFFNVPARRKFLRSISSETRAATEAVATLALAHPAVGFELVVDGSPLTMSTKRGERGAPRHAGLPRSPSTAIGLRDAG